MKFYCILSKKKLYIIIAVLTAALFIIGKVYSDKASVIDGSTHQKRIAFLKGINLCVEENVFSSKEIIIPSEFDQLYKSYNSVQKEAGFDLSRYKGEPVTLYTYRLNDVKNVDLLVLDGQIIGGDISDAKAEGTFYPLR